MFQLAEMISSYTIWFEHEQLPYQLMFSYIHDILVIDYISALTNYDPRV